MTQRFAAYTPAEAESRRAAFLAECLPILRIGFAVIAGRRDLVPLVRLDATGRPELVDLARVRRLDGPGDQTNTVDAMVALPIGETVIKISLELARPVQCAFAMAFDLARYRGWLKHVARAGTLATVFVDEGTSGESESVVWDIAPEDLASALLLDDLARLLRPTEAPKTRPAGRP